MKILFVRHAETDWNKANRFQGIIDIQNSLKHVYTIVLQYNLYL